MIVSNTLDKVVDLVESIKRDAFVRSLRVARAGNSNAQLEVGMFFLNGYGIDTDDRGAVVKNNNRAFYWFMKSAEQNNASAFFMLSNCFEHGIGVQKNRKKADYYLFKAAKLGDKYALLQLAQFFVDKKNFSSAISFLEKLKESDDGTFILKIAQLYARIGFSYIYGDGVDINLEKGLEYIIDAAEMGDAQAQSELGSRYLDGDNVQQDYEKALFYLEKAADQNSPLAIMELARCYENGNGVKKDILKALDLYGGIMEVLTYPDTPLSDGLQDLFDEVLSEIVKYKDSEDIENCIDSPVVLYFLSQEFSGLKNERNPEKSIRFLKKSAEMGYDKAQYELGKLYEVGLLVEKDMDKAIEWIEKAAEQGDDGAVYSLQYLKDPDFFKDN